MAHGGYFENKDLEDILLFSVSNLSRAQVKRLVAKVNSEKDKVGYHHQSPEVKFRLAFFGFKSCVFLAVCVQIWLKFLGDL